MRLTFRLRVEQGARMSLPLITMLVVLAHAAAASRSPDWADEFTTFNTSDWTPGAWLGGWNGEFSFYTGGVVEKARNLFVKKSNLYLKPDLTANYKQDGKRLGWEKVLGCGRTNPADAASAKCTNPANKPDFVLANCSVGDPSKCNITAGSCIGQDDACEGYEVLPPVTSAQLRTTRTFKFGTLEVRARLPKGDWLWPAIWMLPEDSPYGGWPTSGEIDLMESRGNDRNACGPWQDNSAFGSTLHFGPDYAHNAYLHAHTETHLPSPEDLTQEFHTYGLEWSSTGLKTYLDHPNHTVLNVQFNESFWQRGKHWELVCVERQGGRCMLWIPAEPKWSHMPDSDNPWANATAATPYDQKFFLQMNIAVGGTGSFFPDFCRHKPWHNKDTNARGNFLSAFEDWWPTWGGDVNKPEDGCSDHAAMVVDWVRYWEHGK